MKSNYKQKVLEAYSGGGEVNRAAKTGEYGMEFIYTKRALDSYITKKKKVSFGSKLDWMFYKRLFKRRVNKYEIEKAESEKLDGDLPEQEDVTEEATSEEPANENKTAE